MFLVLTIVIFLLYYGRNIFSQLNKIDSVMLFEVVFHIFSFCLGVGFSVVLFFPRHPLSHKATAGQATVGGWLGMTYNREFKEFREFREFAVDCTLSQAYIFAPA